jgi:hypothetical protein
MIAHYVVYAVSTGEVVGQGFCAAADLALQVRAGLQVLEVGGTLEQGAWRVDLSGDDPLLVARIALPAWDKLTVTAGGVDYATCSGLPSPTEVTVRGPSGDVWTETDGVAQVAFAEPGVYRVRLDAGLAYRVREELIRAT